MKRTKFIFKDAYQQAIDLIDDQATKMELLLAITQYGMNGKEYDGDNKIVKMAMVLIMPQIDKENRRYEIKEEQAREAETAEPETNIKVSVSESKDYPQQLSDSKPSRYRTNNSYQQRAS